MNQASDMCTVFGTALLWVFLLIFFPTKGALLSIGLFSAIECMFHVFFGISMYWIFKKDGKKTFYSPGLFTCIFGWLELGIYVFLKVSKITLSTEDIMVAIIIIAIIFGVNYFLAERIFLSKAINYAYPSAGYFKKFETKE